MKTLITICLLLIANLAIAQARLNYTRDEILNEFNYIKPLKQGVDVDNDRYITYILANTYTTYYFRNERCYLTRIQPVKQGEIKNMIQTYNKDLVVISSTKWKLYTDNGIANIQLYYANNRGYFLWEIE